MSVTSLLTNTPADAQAKPAASTTRTRFDPFGTPLTALPDTVPGTSEPGFGTVAGKLTDTITPYGIIDMGARLYSTVLGRFLQVDPVPGGGVNAYAYPPDPVNMNDYSGRVATADSFDRWGLHNAKPTFDGNFQSAPAKYSKLREGRQKAAILGFLSGVLGIAAMLVIAGNPVTLAGWAALTVASAALGLLSTHQSCSIQRKSFDCIFGMVTVGIGGMGSIATVASRTMSVGHLTWGGISAVSDGTNVASFGITAGTTPGLFPSRNDPWWTH